MALGRAMPWPLKAIRSFVLQVEQAKTSIHCLLLMDGIRVALLTSTTLGTLTHMALRLADRTLSLRICLPALTLAVLLSFAFPVNIAELNVPGAVILVLESCHV